MLVRSARTSHARNFQDMWKSKSATPTTSRKAGYTPIKVMNYCFIIVDEVMYRLACPTPHLDVKRSSLAQEIALSASKSKFGSKALSPPRGTSDKLYRAQGQCRPAKKVSERKTAGREKERGNKHLLKYIRPPTFQTNCRKTDSPLNMSKCVV